MGQDTDHDMLIEIRGDVKYIKDDVGEIKKDVKRHDTEITVLQNRPANGKSLKWTLGLFVVILSVFFGLQRAFGGSSPTPNWWIRVDGTYIKVKVDSTCVVDGTDTTWTTAHRIMIGSQHLDSTGATVYTVDTLIANYIDTVTIVSSQDITGANLKSNSNIYTNHNGGEGDAYLYFYEASLSTGASLAWDDSHGFRFSHNVYSDGKFIAHDNININYDGGEGDSYLYFYENTSATGASLMWDDSPGEFVLSHGLKIGAYSLPATDGSNTQVLKTDGSGSVSWGAGGGVAEYLQASKVADQTNFNTNDILIFDAVDISAGSSISLNTTTGIFTLESGKTYELTSGIRFEHTSAAKIGFAWYNNTGSVTISELARLHTMAEGGDYSNLPIAKTIISPSVSTEVSMRCTYDGDGSEDVNGGHAWAIIKVIAGNALYTGEIADGTILEADLNVTNAPTGLDGYLLSLNEGSNNFTWITGGAGETNTLADTGTFNGTEGFGLTQTKAGTELRIRGLIEGSNIAIAASGDTGYTITASGAGLNYFTESDDNDTSVFTATGPNTTVGFNDNLTMQGNNIFGVGTIDAAGDVTLDKGATSSPTLVFTDVDDERFEIYKQYSGDGDVYLTNFEGPISLRSNGDQNDYISLVTTTNVPAITTEGDCDLVISASGGNIFFDDDVLHIKSWAWYTGGDNGGTYDSTDVPSNLDVLTWNTGGAIDWQPASGSTDSALVAQYAHVTDSLALAALLTGPTFTGNVILDAGADNSPLIVLTDGDDETFGMLKHNDGPGIIQNTEGSIQLFTSGDYDDYFEISTTSNVITLETVASGDGDLIIKAGGGDISFDDENLTTSGTITAPLVIGGTGTTSDLSLKTTSGVGTTGADMHFLVGNNGATEAMTILNNGRVGIGTNTPDEILHLLANSAALKLEDDSGNDATINVGNSQLCIAIDPDDLQESSDICFDIDGAEVARFHQSTNFGIGTLSPPERLSVVGNIAMGDTAAGDVDVFHYFSTDGSYTTEYLKWDDGLGGFYLSDDFDVTGNITVSGTVDGVDIAAFYATFDDDVEVQTEAEAGDTANVVRAEIGDSLDLALRLADTAAYTTDIEGLIHDSLANIHDTLTMSFSVSWIDEDWDWAFQMKRKAITIVRVSGLCLEGTNVVGCLMEYDANGANPVTCNSAGDWTFTTGEEETTSIDNPSIDADDYLGWKTTSVSGEVFIFTLTIEYTVD